MNEHQQAEAITKDIRSLSCRKPMAKYGISRRTWDRIKGGGQWSPKNGNGHSEETVQAILAHVKEKPHLNPPYGGRSGRKNSASELREFRASLKRSPQYSGSKLNPPYGG